MLRNYLDYAKESYQRDGKRTPRAPRELFLHAAQLRQQMNHTLAELYRLLAPAPVPTPDVLPGVLPVETQEVCGT